MPTKKTTLSSMERLTRAVRKHGGFTAEDFQAIAEHGAGAGFNGFISTSAMIKFTSKNRPLIMDCLARYADDMGVTSEDCLNNLIEAADADDEARVACVLAHFALDLVANNVAWTGR